MEQRKEPIMRFELQTNNTAQKSFYGKAVVTEEDMKLPDMMVQGTRYTLTSYDTVVATIERIYTVGSFGVDVDDVVKVIGIYSRTTLLHIKEFLRQYGHKAESASQIRDDYLVTDTFASLKSYQNFK